MSEVKRYIVPDCDLQEAYSTEETGNGRTVLVDEKELRIAREALKAMINDFGGYNTESVRQARKTIEGGGE